MLVEDKNTHLIDGIRNAVKARGADYIYQRGVPEKYKICIYFNLESNEPSCLIGHGLAHLGYTPDSEIENQYGESNMILSYFNDQIAPTLLESLNFNRAIIKACRIGQNCQDKGDTWGEALEAIHESLVDSKVASKYWR